MDIIAIGFFKVDKAADRYEYILVTIAQFTRKAHAIRNKLEKAAAENIFSDFLFKFRMPHRILHDRGKEFEKNCLTNYRIILELRYAERHPII